MDLRQKFDHIKVDYDEWPGELIEEALAEIARLRGLVEQVGKLHYLADDDPGGPAYCPECQGYDGTGQPCSTAKLLAAQTTIKSPSSS